jgi:hypothetical protein
MGSRVKSGGFEMTMDVGDGSHRLNRQRNRAVRRHPIDVVHAKADRFEVKRGDGAGEALGLLEHLRQVIMPRERPHQGYQIVDAAFGGQSMFRRHSSDNSNRLSDGIDYKAPLPRSR